MNKRQKSQVIFAIFFAAQFICWLFAPGWIKILGLTYSALGVLSMILSYRDEEKNKKKPE